MEKEPEINSINENSSEGGFFRGQEKNIEDVFELNPELKEIGTREK